MPFAIETATSRELMARFSSREHQLHSLVRASSSGPLLVLACSCGVGILVSDELARMHGLELGAIGARLARLGKFDAALARRAA